MKTILKPRTRVRKASAQTVSLSDAKTYLGRLVDRVADGETIYIARGQKRFVLQLVPDIEPIPMRPPGYFSDCYSRNDIAEMKTFAKASVIRAPEDLE